MDRSPLRPRLRSAVRAPAGLGRRPSEGDPLPLEIALACERIRSRWSQAERQARAPHLHAEPWRAPIIALGELDFGEGVE